MTSPSATRSVRRGAYFLLCAAILVYAFLLCFKSGERGFFPLDQSIMFDGAYRIMSGQVPYRDFVIPVGPMVFCLQALVFKLFGVSFASYLLGAAVVNVLATALSMFIVATLFPGKRFPSLIAGLLTATWFYPPYGSPNMEQTAFFFSLLGIACSVAALCHETLNRPVQALLLGIAGSCAVLSFLSKQNAGAFILPVYPLMFLAACRLKWRELLMTTVWFSVGVVVTAGAFLIWLNYQSDPELFREHVFKIPGQEGIARLLTRRGRLIHTMLGGLETHFVRTGMVVFMAFGALMAWVFGVRRWHDEPASRMSAVAAVLCVYLPFFQIVFYVSTTNQWQECLPFLGTLVACATGLAAQLLDPLWEPTTDQASARPTLGWGMAALLVGAGVAISAVVHTKSPAIVALVVVVVGGIVGVFRSKAGLPVGADPGAQGLPGGWVARRWLFVATIVIAVAGFAGHGIKESWYRSVHDIFADSEFTTYMQVPGLERLKWGHPTAIHETEFGEGDLAALVEKLRHEKKSFFVFPDFTILYGLVGTPSPQPLLWFHKGLTYPRDYDESLDRRIVQSLARHDVELIVLEKDCWWGTNQLEDFPLLDSYIRDDFAAESEIGPFEIRRRVSRDRSL